VAAFEYKAFNQQGRTIKGLANAESARHLRQELREQGLTPIEVTPVAKGRQSTGLWSRQKKLSPSELSVVVRQFATLVGSGLTLEESLKALIDQSEGYQTKSVLNSIRSMVMEGHSLATAIQAYPGAFPEIYHASVAAGERSGKLDTVLDKLADYTEAREGLRQRMLLALIYPLILLGMSLAVIMFLFTYVVPKVVRVFEESGQQLPTLTRVFIAFTDFINHNGLYLLAGVTAFVFLLLVIFRRPAPRMRLHAWLLKAPWIRRLVRGVNTTRMARTLSIMVGSGVPLLTAMNSSAAVVNNLVMRRAVEKAAEEVAEGVSLSRALNRAGHFPPLLVQMVASGEASGQLAQLLDKSAVAQERELETRISVMINAFQPVMILFMGGIVLLIVLAILLPIFDINQLIR
jgi:general secretion pathway protein F